MNNTGGELSELLPGLKEAACLLGADAVLIQHTGLGSSFEQVPTTAYAVAIKYKN